MKRKLCFHHTNRKHHPRYERKTNMFGSSIKTQRHFASTLCGVICLSLLCPIFGVAAPNGTSLTQTPATPPDIASVKVKLYYQREASSIVALLKAIPADETSSLHGLDAGK